MSDPVNPYEAPLTAELVPVKNPSDPDARCERDGERWTLYYNLTRDDFINFGLHHYQTSRVQTRTRTWRALMIVLLHLVAALVVSQLIRAGTITLLVGAVVLGTLAVALLFTFLRTLRYPALLRAQYEKLYSEGRNLALFGTYRLVMTPQKLVVTGPLIETHYQWAAIEKVTHTYAYLYLHLSALNATIIPARAFATHDELDDFRAALEGYRTQPHSAA